MSSCPEEATLRLLGGDGLGDSTYAAIEQHVENCSDCKLVLEQLAHRRGEAPAVFSGRERLPCIPGFEIQRVLDRGATSVVYLAVDGRLNRPVAIKVLPEGLGTDESTRPAPPLAARGTGHFERPASERRAALRLWEHGRVALSGARIRTRWVPQAEAD